MPALHDQVEALSILLGGVELETEKLATRLTVVEAGQAEMAEMGEEVSEIKGMVDTLLALVTARFNLPDVGAKVSGWKFGLQVAAVVGSCLVPIVVALISGYFLVKSSGGLTK